MRKFLPILIFCLTGCLQEFEDVRTIDIVSLNDEWNAYSTIHNNRLWIIPQYDEVMPIDEQTVAYDRNQGWKHGLRKGKILINLNFNSAMRKRSKCAVKGQKDVLSIRFSSYYGDNKENYRGVFFDTSKVWLTLNGKKYRLQQLNNQNFEDIIPFDIINMSDGNRIYSFQLPQECINLDNSILEIGGLSGKGQQNFPLIKVKLNYLNAAYVRRTIQ